METYPRQDRVILALIDIEGFGALGKRLDSLELFDLLNAFFEEIGQRTIESGGQVIKCIGDAALVIFPADQPRQTVGTLRNLKMNAEQTLAAKGHPTPVKIKAHIGSVLIGPLGPRENKCLDILGNEINNLFRLQSGPFVTSPELAACL